MREKNRLGRGRRSGPEGGPEPELLAQQLSEVVQQAFDAVREDANVDATPRPTSSAGEADVLRKGEAGAPVDPAPDAKVPASDGAQTAMPTDDAAKFAISARFPRWKRWLDVICILLTAPFWIPLMIFAVLIIKTVSRGPVFFRQRRVGLGGAHFMILKFRSMQVNAETRTHESYFRQLMQADCPMTKLDTAGDSRLIPGGRLLRATALDELPQIFNVLRGDMSLVGPRPCTPSEFERYQPRHKMRCQFPPGLTGYWQANGKNKTTFSEMIEMDLHYGERMSVWLDIVLMLKTFPTLLEQVWESQKRRRIERKKTVSEPAPAFETIKERTN